MLNETEKKVREYLISIAKEKKVITYGELADHFNLDREDKHQAWIQIIEGWFENINNFEVENKRPLLSAIVVFKKNPKDINSLWECGNGFYNYARDKGLLKRGEDRQVFHAGELGNIFRYWHEHSA